MVESLERVDADQLVVVREGAGIVDKVRLNSQAAIR
jgi:hypothetical protein